MQNLLDWVLPIKNRSGFYLSIEKTANEVRCVAPLQNLAFALPPFAEGGSIGVRSDFAGDLQKLKLEGKKRTSK